MKISFKGVVVLTVDHQVITQKSKHVATDFNLEVSENLVERKYLKEGLPTKHGSHALSNVLVQGLVANMHMAHQKGYRDSAEHLRWIISELERGFVQVTRVTQSNFKKG